MPAPTPSSTPGSVENTARRGQVAELREMLARDGGSDAGFHRTGFAGLDAWLPGGGLPMGAVTECIGDVGGGRSSFMLAMLRRVLIDSPTARAMIVDTHGRWFAAAMAQAGVPLDRVVIVRPPTMPLAVWAVEQALTSGAVPLVMAELARLDAVMIRRLQLAAESTGAMALIARPTHDRQRRGAGALQLTFSSQPVPREIAQAEPFSWHTRVEVSRCRGGMRGGEFDLQFCVPVLELPMQWESEHATPIHIRCAAVFHHGSDAARRAGIATAGNAAHDGREEAG